MEDGPRILVVEDEVFILHLVESTLEEGGFKVIPVTSGEQAIQMLDTHNSAVRAVITDVNLGRSKLTGWDIARYAREVNPNTVVIYMTGHGADEWTSHGLPNSILMTKPFAPAQILTALSNLLNQT